MGGGRTINASSTNNQPLVSVIIPAYNHEKYVQETVKSIINQTYKNIELIIIDDGSKDSTFEKIKEMKNQCTERFSSFVFETQENQGTCNTLNKLLSLSKGEYIYLIASDDISKPEAISIEVDFLNNNPDYALVVGDSEFIDSEGKVCYWDENQNNVYSLNEAKYTTFAQSRGKKYKLFNTPKFGKYSTFLSGNYVPNGYLFRKSILSKVGNFTPEAPLEDYFLMLQISKYSKLKFIDKILFSYRWHGLNTASNTKKMLDIVFKTFHYEENLMKNINKSDLLPELRKPDKFGYIYKHFGIKYVLDVSVYKTIVSKTIAVRLLNIPVFVKYKKIY